MSKKYKVVWTMMDPIHNQNFINFEMGKFRNYTEAFSYVDNCIRTFGDKVPNGHRIKSTGWCFYTDGRPANWHMETGGARESSPKDYYISFKIVPVRRRKSVMD